MKAIEELGISPRPWKVAKTYGGIFVKDRIDLLLSANDSYIEEDARLVSSSPELYECLREAIEDKCEQCKSSWCGDCVTKDGSPCAMVAKWKSALAKASGEVVK